MRVVVLRLTAVLLVAFAVVPMAAPPRASAQVTDVPDVLWGAGLRPGTTVEATIGGKSCGSTEAQPNGVWALYVVDDPACDDVPLASWELQLDGGPSEDLLFGIEHALLPEFVIGLQPQTDAPGQINLTTFGGGPLDSLQWSLRQSGLRSMFFTEDGGMVGYTDGAPPFVNQAFNDAFEDGVPSNQPLIVVQDPNYLPLPIRLLPNAGTYMFFDGLDTGMPNDLTSVLIRDDGTDTLFEFTSPEGFTFNSSGPFFSSARIFFDNNGDGLFDTFVGGSHGEGGAGSTTGGPTFPIEISPADPEGATAVTVTTDTSLFSEGLVAMAIFSQLVNECREAGCEVDLFDFIPNRPTGSGLPEGEQSPDSMLEIFFPERQ